MPKPQSSFLQPLIDLLTSQSTSQVFQDYHILLILRFMIYLYLFVKLSDIFLGYAKPNLRTRVLRKFQFVYGDQILRELDREDMQELEVTINNTILNATKELVGKKTIAMMEVSNQTEMKLSKGYDEQGYCGDSTGSSLSKKSFKLKFDLQRNQYYDHPSSLNSSKVSSIITEQNLQQSRSSKTSQIQKLQIFANEAQTVEGQNQEQKLSPTHSTPSQPTQKQFTKNPIKPNQQNQVNLLPSEGNQTIEDNNIIEGNITYPKSQLQGMDLGVEQTFVKKEQDLLQLNEDTLYQAMLGNQSVIKSTSSQFNQQQEQHLKDSCDESFANFQSIMKPQSTKVTESQVSQLET